MAARIVRVANMPSLLGHIFQEEMPLGGKNSSDNLRNRPSVTLTCQPQSSSFKSARVEIIGNRLRWFLQTEELGEFRRGNQRLAWCVEASLFGWEVVKLRSVS